MCFLNVWLTFLLTFTADFAEAYADQTERDHAALLIAIREGRVQAQTGL